MSERLHRAAKIRDLWLEPPAPGTEIDPELRERAEAALRELDEALERGPARERIDLTLLCEAQSSSLIENVDADPRKRARTATAYSERPSTHWAPGTAERFEAGTSR